MQTSTARIPALRPGILSTLHANSLLRTDIRNLSLLMLGFLLVLLLIPPARAYPMIDDWVYARSSQDLLNGVFTPHDYTEANAFGHNILGALAISLLGFSFTSLSIANLFASAACLIIFYTLLRHLDVAPAPALWGTAILGLNPLYLHLSYSFMTDVTFLAYMLLACLCYVRGMRGHSHIWLWVGALVAALSFLTRQFGILLVPAALAYLWWSRRWTWRNALAVAALPVAVLASYLWWDTTLPPRLVNFIVEDHQSYTAQHPLQYVEWRVERISWALSVLGLCLLPLATLPRRPLAALPFFGLLLFFQFQGLQLAGTIFPQNGNIIDHTGLMLFSYNAAPIWNEAIWSLIGVASSLALSLFLAACAEQLWRWLQSRPWRARAGDASLLLYFLGLMTAGVVLFVTPFLFDRYWLALLPIAILASLKLLATRYTPLTQAHFHLRWLFLLPVALFSLISQADYSQHAQARWQAAEQLAAQGVPRRQVDAGYEWAGHYLYDEGAARIRAEGDFTNIPFPAYAALDPKYTISDIHLPGYTQVGSIPYTSWLTGGQQRNVLLLKRD
jgi:4-amino-4-deoxy-L-arabinose transferase-like glycosyltransferase